MAGQITGLDRAELAMLQMGLEALAKKRTVHEETLRALYNRLTAAMDARPLPGRAAG